MTRQLSFLQPSFAVAVAALCLSPRSSCADNRSGHHHDGRSRAVSPCAQIAFVGFRDSDAESGRLPLAARSTEFTDSGTTIGDDKCRHQRKFPSASRASIPSNHLHHCRTGNQIPIGGGSSKPSSQHPAVSSFALYSTSANQRLRRLQRDLVTGRRRTNLNRSVSSPRIREAAIRKTVVHTRNCFEALGRIRTIGHELTFDVYRNQPFRWVLHSGSCRSPRCIAGVGFLGGRLWTYPSTPPP